MMATAGARDSLKSGFCRRDWETKHGLSKAKKTITSNIKRITITSGFSELNILRSTIPKPCPFF